MGWSRRATLAGIACLGGCARHNSTGRFPAHAMRMTVPFAPGGPTDLVGRLVASRIEALWHQPVVVDNRPGASGSIGADQVLQRAPDGYSLCFGNNASHASYEVLHPELAPYVTLRDFAPVALIGFTQTIMTINAALPVHSLAEFVAYARAHPGQLNYGSPAFGSAPHLACELLKLRAGIDMQLVNYNGTSSTMLALAANEIQVYMGGASSVGPLVRSGRIRALAVMSDSRCPELPTLPTAAEAGYPEVKWDSWYGIFASARVPAPLLDAINAVINQGMAPDAIDQRLLSYGLRRSLGTRGDFARVIHNEVALTREVATRAGLGDRPQ